MVSPSKTEAVLLLHPLQEQRRSFQPAANHGEQGEHLWDLSLCFFEHRGHEVVATGSSFPAPSTVCPSCQGETLPNIPLLRFFSKSCFWWGTGDTWQGKGMGIVPWMISGHTLHPTGHGHVPGVSLIPKTLSSSPLSHQDSREGLCKSQGAFGALRIPERTGMVLPHPPRPHPCPTGEIQARGALLLLHH